MLRMNSAIVPGDASTRRALARIGKRGMGFGCGYNSGGTSGCGLATCRVSGGWWVVGGGTGVTGGGWCCRVVKMVGGAAGWVRVRFPLPAASLLCFPLPLPVQFPHDWSSSSDIGSGDAGGVSTIRLSCVLTLALFTF